MRSVLYQLHSLGAAGVAAVNPDIDATQPHSRGLRMLQGWLDHVTDLGCDGVLLTPIFVSSTHGYDTVDPFRMDQRLGDDSDFDAFVDAAHRLDLRVILDGVFNHVGRAFQPFRDVLANKQNSSSVDWFRLDFSRDDGDGFAYRNFEGHLELVSLNHQSPAVLDWASSVALHWLDRGIDGWRLDAAYAIPTAFLAGLSERVHRNHPNAFVFGEIIHGDYSQFMAAAGIDSATQYELYKAIWSSLNDANFFELAWAIERHARYCATFPPITFIGNHDVTRIASQLHDVSHLAHALAVLFTVPGRPCVYYGDELAWRGLKEARAGGDDAIRPALPADARPRSEELAGALGLHRDVIGLRRSRSWLGSGAVDIVTLANRQITFTISSGNQQVLTTLDVDGGTITPPPGWQPLLSYPGVAVCELLRG